MTTIQRQRIYEDALGGWILSSGGIKHHFETEEEARMAGQKQLFAEKVQGAATTLAQVGDQLDNLFSVWFDRGYNSGGSNAIDDDDLTALGITAAQLGSMMTLAEQFDKFLNNQSVTSGDYDSVLNAVRTDV